MRPDEVPVFAQWLTLLKEHWPESPVNLESVFEEYFVAVEPLDSRLLRCLLRELVHTCDWFPRVKQVIAAVARLLEPDPCARCPGGHGVHAGHTVGHYDLGPFCHDCQVDMPMPPGYRPPTRILTTPAALPQQTATMPPEELDGLLADLYAAVDKRAAALEWPPGWPAVEYASQLTAEAAAARRAALRQQAQALGQEPAP